MINNKGNIITMNLLKIKKELLILCLLQFCHNVYGMDNFSNKYLPTIQNSNEKNSIAETQPYIACESFSTDRCFLHRIKSAKEEIDCYKAMYQEDEEKTKWFSRADADIILYDKSTMSEEQINHYIEEYDAISITDHNLIQQKNIEHFHKKEQSGFYQFPISFYDYIILDKKNKELVGKYIFQDYVKNGRIETGIYLMNPYKGNGFGTEIRLGINTNIIDPAIGKPFVTANDQNFKKVLLGITNPKFEGTFGKTAPIDNYPSLSTNHKTGSAIRWEKEEITTFYPRGNESCMSNSEAESFKLLIKLIFTFNKEMISIRKITGDIDREPKATLEQIIRYFHENENVSLNDIIESLSSLLDTNDYLTLLSTMDALFSLKEDSDYVEHLKALIPSTKFRKILNILNSSDESIPPKVYSFIRDHKELLETLSKDESSVDSDGEITEKSNKKRYLDICDADNVNDQKRQKNNTDKGI